MPFNEILFGGDYCPEQWDESVWAEDICMMKSYGVNTATINVHSWFMLEKTEGKFDFTFLDKIVSLLNENDIKIIMATGSTAVPAWMAEKYPDVIRTDIHGHHHKYGVREKFCPTNQNYREGIKALCNALANHYEKETGILIWHINNELSGYCYCEHCAANFRVWLQKRYGTIERLNEEWCTAMWGRSYTNFNQIEPPSALNELYENINNENFNLHSLPTEAIEYSRFMTDMHCECFETEAAEIKKSIPNAVVTNNYQFRTFDYNKISRTVDVISYDTYPLKDDASYVSTFNYDLCRCVKGVSMPFLIMEMSPNHSSWEKCATLKRPGQVSLTAINAIAHGADSALFFQIRQSRTGFEKFHGAMISHVGHINTRIGQELLSLGKQLKQLSPHLIGTNVQSKAAVIMDWDAKLGVEIPCSMQKNIDYMNEVKEYYRALQEKNISVDVIPIDHSFEQYRLIVAPMLYMITKENAQRLSDFVEKGGILITTYFSGLADLLDNIYPNGYPGVLRKLLGVWVEETDALLPSEHNTMNLNEGFDYNTFDCGFLCDLLHTEGARVLGTYGNDFYKGMPCLTEHAVAQGKAVYIASKPSLEGISCILTHYIKAAGISPVLHTPKQVEATCRSCSEHELLFLMNHASTEQTVKVPAKDNWRTLDECHMAPNELLLPSKGYAIYQRKINT